MKLHEFFFELPDELIALKPSDYRDECKLMVVNRKEKTIEHKLFKDIIDYFDEGDVFVTNNTKVFPAKLRGEKEKTGAEIIVFLLHELNREAKLWDVYVEPARKIRIGNKLYFGENDELVAEVIDNTTSRGRTLRFLYDGSYDSFKKIIYKLGSAPVPEYILNKRKEQGKVSEQDKLAYSKDIENYQTIFAKEEGAVMAPSAGMHFSKTLLKKMELKGIETAELTLHCSLGSIKEIDVEDLQKHKMDSEEFHISQETADKVNAAKKNGYKIIGVGTTVIKSMESSTSIDGFLKPYDGWTNKFIYPPYDFRVANAMVTNFHAPSSSLLMMVCAFGGYELVMKAYKEAIAKKYRLLAYGDAMLII